MKFKAWFTQSGLEVVTLARMCGVTRNTIQNLLDGKNPYFKTVAKLIRNTKSMKNPVSLDMFKEIKGKRKFRLKKK